MENFDDNSIIIGITGGIGTGKSTAAALLAAKGFPLISLDDLAKEIISESDIIKKRIANAFGKQYINPDGSLNKALVSANVFSSTQESTENLKTLNSIVHPFVIDKMISMIDNFIEKGNKLIFVESAILFETGLDEGFNYIIAVDSPEELCIQRVMKRSGLTETEVKFRIAQQMSNKEKSQLADFCIINDGNMKKLEDSVNKLFDIIKIIVL